MEGLLVNIFPNPATDEFTINISGAEAGTIVISDVLGRIVYSNNLSSSFQCFKVGGEFSPGTYIVKIFSTNDSRIVKVVKE
jgi:hypothetical protein